MHFDAIGRVPGDPILGLMEAYAQDSNPRKFDLGVGVYKDAQGLTPIPEAVKIAEARLVESQDTKTYIGGHGNPLFGKVINELVLGADSKLIAEQRAGATQKVRVLPTVMMTTDVYMAMGTHVDPAVRQRVQRAARSRKSTGGWPGRLPHQASASASRSGVKFCTQSSVPQRAVQKPRSPKPITRAPRWSSSSRRSSRSISRSLPPDERTRPQSRGAQRHPSHRRPR